MASAPLAITARGVSFIADNLILLRYVEVEGEIKRVAGVLKMRGSRHDHHLRELIIDLPRIVVGAPLRRAGLLETSASHLAAREA